MSHPKPAATPRVATLVFATCRALAGAAALTACSSGAASGDAASDAAEDEFRRRRHGTDAGASDAAPPATDAAAPSADAGIPSVDSGSSDGSPGAVDAGPVTTIAAATCAQTDVLRALAAASAASGAVVVELPPCAQAWSGDLRIDLKGGFGRVVSLTLRGSGALVRRGASGATAVTGGGVYVTSTPGKRVRVSNLVLQGTVTIEGDGRPGNGGGFRVDHLTFKGASDRVVWVGGYTYGVIDSSVLTTTSAVVVGIRESVNGDGGNASWARGPSFGTAEAVYVEDNDVTHVSGAVHMCIDSDGGGRYVFRHNTTTDCYAGTHDASSIGETRAAYSWEIYANTMTTTKSWASGLTGLRGGTGYHYDNDLVATDPYPFYGDPIVLSNYRSFDYASAAPWTTGCDATKRVRICTAPPASARACASDSDCGGTTGSCQAADDPAGDGAGYPCRDQIGRSTGMALRPALFWNNRLKVAGGAFSSQPPGVSAEGRTPQHIVPGRDYCHSDGAMPASCGGVATDYKPYAYPHPMRD